MKNLLCLFFIILITSCSISNNSEEEIIENPAIKTITTVEITDNGNSFIGVNDIINYTIKIKNNSNTILTDINLTIILKDLSETSLSLDTSPIFLNADAGSTIGIIQIGETATYNAFFTITQNEVNAGGISLSVLAKGKTPQGTTVSDISDNGDDSNNPTETLIEINPTIIKEYHILNTNGNIQLKYIFNEDGRLTQLHQINSIIINYIYYYDSQNKLITIIKQDENGNNLENIDFTYNSNSKITNINDRTFSYNPDITNYLPIDNYTFPIEDNFYIEDSTYSGYESPTNEDETETSFDIYVADINGMPKYSCNYQLFHFPDDNVFESCNNQTFWNYSDKLLISDGYVDAENNYEYDTNLNPLFFEASNMSYIAPFYSYQQGLSRQIFNRQLLSRYNTIVHSYAPSDPEHSEYIYQFNNNNLPIKVLRQDYYVGILENEYFYAYYYYQGDIIPE